MSDPELVLTPPSAVRALPEINAAGLVQVRGKGESEPFRLAD